MLGQGLLEECDYACMAKAVATLQASELLKLDAERASRVRGA